MEKYNNPVEDTKLLSLSKKLSGRKYITLFGSSLRDESDPSISYWDSITKHIAESNWGLLTGGYNGTMSYFSSNLLQEGGTSIGINCSNVLDKAPCECYSDLISVPTHFHRLEALLTFGNAYFILPGGIGTLVELACSIWLQDREFINNRPIFVFGHEWNEFLEWFNQIPNGLRGKRNLEQLITVIPDLNSFEKEWIKLTKTANLG